MSKSTLRAMATLEEVLARIEQTLAAQAASTEVRFAQGDSNVQNVVHLLEQRIEESEQKTAAALTALQGAMVAFQGGVEQKLASTED